MYKTQTVLGMAIYNVSTSSRMLGESGVSEVPVSLIAMFACSTL